MAIGVINEAIRGATETCPVLSEREIRKQIPGSDRLGLSDPIVTDQP